MQHYDGAHAADVFWCAHAPEDSIVGAGASYGACATVDNISDVFFSDSEANRILSCSWDLWDCASCGAIGVAL
jgi:hypothetical protein